MDQTSVEFLEASECRLLRYYHPELPAKKMRNWDRMLPQLIGNEK